MKTKHRKILLIVLLIISIVLLVVCGYLIYKRSINKNAADVVIIDNLSINYLSGRKFDFTDKEKEIEFSIINDDNIPYNIDIFIKNIEIGSDVTYSLYEKNNLIVSDSLKKGNIKILESKSIDSNATKSFKLIIENKDAGEVKFKLDIKKSQESDNSVSKVILNNNEIKQSPSTEIGKIANTDEGLILDVDDSGNTYYFRGNVKNNYLKINDKMWRIVRVNGNGTVKIVLDDTILSTALYDSDHSKLSTLKKYSDTSIYKSLNEWYEENLKDYDEQIAPYKYCLDTNKTVNDLNSYLRINVNNNPTFNCLGEKTESKIGILTADEVVYAGASTNEFNTTYYLSNPNINSSWWTLSPAKEEIFGIFFYEVNNGMLTSTSTGEASKAIRPVINIKKDVVVTGTGLENDPYVLK